MNKTRTQITEREFIKGLKLRSWDPIMLMDMDHDHHGVIFTSEDINFDK